MLALCALAACHGNETGRWHARTGDLSAGPTRREPAGRALRAACGGVLVTPAGRALLGRVPYLQRVSEQGAVLVWTQRSAAPPARLRVRPAGGAAWQLQRATGEAATGVAGFVQWQVALTRLAPATRYCYELHDGTGQLLFRAGFASAPAAGDRRAVRIGVLGDVGSGLADQWAVARALATVPLDLVLLAGDLAYDSGSLAEFDRNFFPAYAQLMPVVPFFPASGNHEYETADAAPFRQVFVLFDNGGPHGRERWYSFDWGQVHVAVLDSERLGAVQAAWLDRDLAATTRRWKLVLLHRPPFSSGVHGGDPEVRSWFVPIFERRGVALVLAGHDHDYERTHALRGVVYVVSGGGGRGSRPVGRSSFTAHAAQVAHLVQLVVTGAELRLHAIDASGREFDSAVLSARQ